MRERMLRKLAGLAATLLFSAGASADGPGDWLMQVSQATRTANYAGVIVYRGDEVLETFRVTHRYSNGIERERVQSLTGEVREILKNNDQVTCILPKDRKLIFNRPTPKGLFPPLNRERVEQLSAMYDFKDLGTARVAGRMCRGVAITPRDDFRYGYVVWADSETAVPLKLSMVAGDGRLLEQMFFTEVEFPASIPDSVFVAALPREQLRESTTAAAGAIAAAHVQEPVAEIAEGKMVGSPFSKLPPGFRLVRREVRRLPNNRGVVEHLVLSDGLSAVSVFRTLQRAPDEKAVQRLVQMGAVNAYSRLAGKVHITVVGEAPQRTVRMIGDSLQMTSLAGITDAELEAEAGAAPSSP